MEITWRVISQSGKGENGGKGSGNKKYNFQVQSSQEEVKNNRIGNGEAKELICMTHGHELRRGMWVGGGMQEEREIKGGNGTTIIA